ncbi:MAG: SusC/RagA family TonB-linked outer membrane protein [Cyclobacteriaceae bacterium]|jgi:TonB-linked SusC/RagA family outer membrane protein|nr:SusC/RagA family TonB-linked outer membrane protein [Flammeovirgaceae bacterium]
MKKILLICFFIACVPKLMAQQSIVSGKVTSAEDGSPLPGVNVLLKGTTTGTVTDTNGIYSLSAPSDAVLVVSFIGLKTVEVPVNGRSTIDIQLASDVTQLSEIVVTGTGVATEKRKLAIAVESVGAKDLPIAPTASIDQALVGKIAGAQISSTDGTPGARINILLRGVNTINRTTSPMIMVDGVQLGATDLNSIDLNTVERVEVVQGAAAATIYGAQGANGVIQLFTKKGKAGKVNVDISTGISFNELINSGNVRQSRLHNFATNTAGELVDGSGNVIAWNPNTGIYTGNIVYNALDPNGKFDKPYAANLPYIDQVNRYLTTAKTINNSIVLSGGRDKSDFSIAVSNNRQESNFKGDGYNDRTNFTANLGFEIAKGLELRSITQLVYTKNTINFFNTPGFGGGSVIYNLLNTRPFADYEARDIDGNYGFRLGDAAGVNGRNPNYRYQFSDRQYNKVDVLQNLSLTYKFPKYIELSAKYGLNYRNAEEKIVIDNQSSVRNIINSPSSFVSIFNSTTGGEIVNRRDRNVFQNFIASINGVVDFKEDLKLNFPLRSTTLALFDYRRDDFKDDISYGLNLPTFKPYTGAQANTFRIDRDFTQPFITYGYLLNQRFDYDDFVGLSVGFRSDYSSAFGAGSKPFTFPRADGYLRLSGLGFWDNSGLSKTILEFKLRGAWGQAGIQPRPFDRYVTLNTRVFGSGVSFEYPAGQSNPNLDVEVSEETEFGTDVNLDLGKGNWFKTLSLSATLWNRSTKNAIYDVDAAPSSGIGTVKDNAFSLASNGFQFTLSTPVYSGSKLNWNFTTNFGRQYSEITSVKGNGQVVVLSNAGSSNYVLRAGEAVGQLYGYVMLRSVGQTDENGVAWLTPAQQANAVVASNGYVVDRTTKQPYATNKLYSLGNAFPKFNMSFIQDLTYKNFLTLSIQLDWVYKSHLYNQTKSWMYRDGISSDYEKPITIDGETGAFTAFYRGVYQAGAFNGTKDYFYEEATFLRLRNVAVGLDFDKLFNIPGFNKLQLILGGRNLWTLTDYTGFDPEVSSGANNSAFDRGVDHSTLPNPKSYQLTLNIGF